MIERAGVGVAVNNADEALKEKADYVCELTNEEGAVTEVINRFGYK
jgi:hydroxymethylpyrimidine pyrophosphatase-like HAD family hydrolase